MQPVGFWQRFTVGTSADAEQSAAQQSPLSRQTSPIGRHPETNWQTFTPVPGFAQTPEQHSK
jgi:hypothetical protein